MKKIYSLAISLLMSCGAFAKVDETFVFTDASGNVIENGATITVNNYEIDEWTEKPMFNSGLYVKNASDGNAICGMALNISEIDNGALQHCFPGTCHNYSEPKSVELSDVAAIKVGESKNIQSEWLPEEMGNCTVTYTILLMSLVKPIPPTYTVEDECASVTVKYVYDSHSTGIKDVQGSNTANQQAYNLSGQKVSSGYKGIVVQGGKKRLVK